MAITKCEYENARKRALEFFEKAKIALRSDEKKNLEIADFGLGDLEHFGVQLVVYINTNRVCAKEVVLFPWQICPEHRHPPYDNHEGKEETFRCRYGTVYLYVEGSPTPSPKARLPEAYRKWFTVWHEIVLNPGDQYTVEPNQLHWFQAGPEGAILSEFSTTSTDDKDIFTCPMVIREPKIID